MLYKVLYTLTAEKDLAVLPRAVAKRIVSKISEYTHQETPLKKA